MLEGIGYYEMIPKTGVFGASFAGNAEIVFYGQGMSHNPASIGAVFTNSFLGASQGGAPNQRKYHSTIFEFDAFGENFNLNICRGRGFQLSH